MKLSPIHEDNHLLVLFKAHGLLVQGDVTGDPCLLDLGKAYLKERYGKPGKVFLGLVHRLDRPAAGLVVFARTSKAAARLSAQFRDRRVEKGYVVAVEGRPPGDSGELRQRLVWDEERRLACVGEGGRGKEARLRWTVEGELPGGALLGVELLTGRKHQIRAQMAAMGHPVQGDRRYGARESLSERRIALWARSLAFDHPTRTERMRFEMLPPAGWPAR